MGRLAAVAIFALTGLIAGSTALAQNASIPYPLWMQCYSSTLQIVSPRPHKLGSLFEIAPPFDVEGKSPIGPNDVAECRFASGKVVRIETTQEPESERGECGADQNNGIRILLDGRILLDSVYASCFDIDPLATVFIDDDRNYMDVCYSTRQPAFPDAQIARARVAVRCEMETLLSNRK